MNPLALLVCICVADATPECNSNLLRNPEFMQTCGEEDKLTYFETGENGWPIVEINIPCEWEYWWARPEDDEIRPAEDYKWGRPEFVLRTLPTIEVDRELVAGDRDRCQKSFTAWRPKHDRFFQTVHLAPGRYRFTWTVTQHQRSSVHPSIPAESPETGMMRLYAIGEDWKSDEPLRGYDTYPNMTPSEMELEFTVSIDQDVQVGLEMVGRWPVTDNAWWIRNDPKLVRLGDVE
jgi:hypothetical protein